MKWDVIVLGAGVAGLAAARSLAEAGRRVLLLEARSRVGGRMHTEYVAGVAHPVELGAEFIHGRPPELLALLAEAGLAVEETAGEQLCYAAGAVTACEEQAQPWDLLEGMGAAAAARGDMSFEAYLAQGAAEPGKQARARNFVEGFNAADARVIGIAGLARQQAAEDAIEGDRSARVVRGYAALAEYLRTQAVAAGVEVLLDTPAAEVRWGHGACAVRARDGRHWESRRVICALPLGVLQSGSVRFDPAPHRALEALHRLRSGNAQRMVLLFDEAWWQEQHPRMRFLFAPELFPPTWWTTAPHESPQLTGWVGGPRADAVVGQQQFLADALQSLSRIFGRDAAAMLRSAHWHSWQTDPWSLGAYSYVPAGAAGAAEILAEPVDQALFFAGEHTDITGHPGTVHGALRSGLRAARQALDVV